MLRRLLCTFLLHVYASRYTWISAAGGAVYVLHSLTHIVLMSTMEGAGREHTVVPAPATYDKSAYVL